MQDKLIEESRCAHKRVVHRPMPIEGGLWTDRWYCDLCRCEFTPLAVRRSHCDAGTDEGLRKALAEAADQSARNAGCNCSRKIPYLDFSHEKTCPLYSWACRSSTAQLDAEDQHRAAEPVRPKNLATSDPEGHQQAYADACADAEPVEDVVDPITQLAMILHLTEAIAAALVERRTKWAHHR